jgi:hypothetical protein
MGYEMFIYQDIKNRFGFHPATPEAKAKYEDIRQRFTDLALNVTALIPDTRETALFLTKLQEAQMWAISSIAVNNTPLET